MQKSVTLTVEKETKGTWRFKEDGPDESHMFGTIYVKKASLKGETPKKLIMEVATK